MQIAPFAYKLKGRESGREGLVVNLEGRLVFVNAPYSEGELDEIVPFLKKFMQPMEMILLNTHYNVVLMSGNRRIKQEGAIHLIFEETAKLMSQTRQDSGDRFFYFRELKVKNILEGASVVGVYPGPSYTRDYVFYYFPTLQLLYLGEYLPRPQNSLEHEKKVKEIVDQLKGAGHNPRRVLGESGQDLSFIAGIN